jgi:solute carrier family 45 protein 1/2/4
LLKVGSMVFLAQFTISLFIGTLIKIFNTNTVVVYSASVFAFCGAVSANFLLYTEH